MRTPYESHVLHWQACKLCPLCDTRKHVVLVRGRLPCDTLFVGEAPGESEDVLGSPFRGPAGHLLDLIIERALEGSEARPRIALTNLVACIPRDGADKAAEPPPKAIRACADRLNELVQIADPKIIIGVGKLAENWLPKLLSPTYVDCHTVNIVHPAAILRAPVVSRGLLAQRCEVVLASAFYHFERS